jgi:hypothetical protein
VIRGDKKQLFEVFGIAAFLDAVKDRCLLWICWQVMRKIIIIEGRPKSVGLPGCLLHSRAIDNPVFQVNLSIESTKQRWLVRSIESEKG